jgi:hypothetical protein
MKHINIRNKKQRRYFLFDNMCYRKLRDALRQHNLILISLYVFKVKHDETY